MPKLLLINSVCGVGSTGKICAEIADRYSADGYEVKIAYGRSDNVPDKYRKYAVRIGSNLSVKFHGICTRIFDNHGLNSKIATRRFLKWAEEFNPDELWLHNIHGYYINYPMLFKWIKSRPDMKVRWTLHDCWAFTGHCAYFTYVGCEKWKTGCSDCPQKNTYPESKVFDCSRKNYSRKQASFCGVKNLTIITPSKWLADLVKDSLLSEYNTKVIYNTINTDIFKPTPSDFRQKHNLENKKIILGVANIWEKRKGFEDFLELSKLLDDSYVIVLVGLDEKQLQNLPKNIIGIRRTDSQEQLAGLYSTADVFVNPSKEETFGMTVLESISCGTKAIIYKGTACEEVCIDRNTVMIADNIFDIRNIIGFL